MNRSAIILNFLSLACMVIFFELLITFDWYKVLLIYEVAPALVFLITLFRFFIKGRIYRVTLRKNEKTLNIYYWSYSIYTILVTLTLMILFFASVELNMVIISSMLYLAFITPFYLFAWKSDY